MAPGDVVLAQESISDQIFLLPNGTFFYELILFVVVFFLFVKFIVPPIRKALAEREERIKQTQRDKENADAAYAETERKHAQFLSEARGSAGEIRDQARASGRETAAELRGQAESEVAEARQRGDRELSDQRSRVQSDLHGQLPDLAGTLAERILGRSLSGDHSSTTREYVNSLSSGSGGSSGGSTALAGAGSGSGSTGSSGGSSALSSSGASGSEES